MTFPDAKPLVLAACAALALAAACSPVNAQTPNASVAAEKPLTPYRDKNRVLAVFAPTPQDSAYQEQMKLWQGEKAGFDDRQLVVLPFFANTKKPASEDQEQAQALALMKRRAIGDDSFAVILIGKDGKDAFHSSKPVPASTLYAVIDAMPMRRAESRRTASASPSPTPVPTPRRPDLDHDE